jgi:hypothetical protein
MQNKTLSTLSTPSTLSIYIYIDVAKIIAGKLSAAQTGVENDSLSHHKNKSTFGASGDPKSRAA